MTRFLFLWLMVMSYSTQSTGLDVDINVFSFFSNKTYAEIHLRVNANSVEYFLEEGKEKASVECILIVTDGNKNSVYADKFVLNASSENGKKDFITQKRFYIQPGNYSVYIMATDLKLPENKIELERQFSVMPDFNGKFGLSDPIILANKTRLPDNADSNMGRHGFFIEPLSYGFADSSINVVYFLQEIYMTDIDSNEIYFLNYTISDKYKENVHSKVLISQYKKLENTSLQFVMIPLSLKELVSGQYHLSTHLQTKDKTRLNTRKVNFYKSNPYADIDMLELENSIENSFVQSLPSEELDYILKALVPIIDNIQLPTLQTVIQSSSEARKRKYIHRFWLKRSAEKPEEAFLKYMEVARAVDKEFYSSVGYGFETHRGYMFLKHGKPSSVLSIDNEPDAPPYEIWYYNKIMTTNQTNVRFIFYNQSLAHNDFWLLHSTCYGERNNPAWEHQLYSSVSTEKTANDLHGEEVKRGWNRQARIYFNQF
ncbi:MAG: GWxTD domain-containing protein [Saprospiraceae bacterium]|nr:GWxTD domain-containing protein [Saprospiraceae bacterium]